MNTTTSAQSWALCIATYNRRPVLVDCLRHALQSTLPPSEIIVIDASADWADNRDAVQPLVSQDAPCALRYLPAERKSASAQRNQAIRQASADILFLIDDDSMLHPQTAARIMDYYGDDAQGQIAAISCCNTPLNGRPAPVVEVKHISRAGVLTQGRGKATRTAMAALARHGLMIPADQRFVRYDRPARRFRDRVSLPEGLLRVEFIVGFALTVRRDIALREPFDDGLVGSSIAEDLDASYRYGRHGVLAFAPDAPIDHLEAASGRSKRRLNAALAVLNVGYFVRRHSDRPSRDFARYAVWYLRMLAAELPKDIAGGRLSLPQVRGILLAGRHLPALWCQSRASLPDWYRDRQTRLITGAATSPDVTSQTPPSPGARH